MAQVRNESRAMMGQIKKRKATPATDRVPNKAMKYILEAVNDTILDVY